MKKMLIRRITRQQEQTCFYLCNLYYKRIESGKSIWDILKPRYYKLLLQRFFLIFCTIFRFKKSSYAPYLKIFNQTSFTFLIKKNKSIQQLRFEELFFALAGLRYFVHEKYIPVWYEDNISTGELSFKNHDYPQVSIIIPVYNQIHLTLNCLKAVKENSGTDISYEVIVADDFSTDETGVFLPKVPGIVYRKNTENLGFLLTCNQAAAKAKGRYICFLNNDTLVQENWLTHLIKTYDVFPNTGAVGAKLIYPYGLLQEAGGIIWSDGSGANYGKFDHPVNQRYNFARSVDYCSGACLLLEKALFNSIGGFDERYMPAYYEDTDLCFTIRHKLNKQIIYQPSAVVVHLEGASSGKVAKQGNIKSYQDRNRIFFIERWSAELQNNNFSHNHYLASRKYIPKKSVLVIDSYLPHYDKESGSRRIFEIIKIMLSLDYHVVFIPADAYYPEPYYTELMSRGVEMIYRYFGNNQLRDEIKRVTKEASAAWISRPEFNERYQYLFEINTDLKWIYDTVDIHYLRLNRAKVLFPDKAKKLDKKASYYFTLEIEMAKKADLTIAITDVEKEELKSRGIKHITVVPNIHQTEKRDVPVFYEREGLLFIGSYIHHPNTDAAVWLCQDIMPLVWDKIPEVNVTLVGSNPSDEIYQLENERVKVTGFVNDVSPYFNKARVFVSPLRYGAGMKGKIGQALEHNLPIVTTSIGAEGMNLKNGENVYIAETKKEIAEKILRLYESESEWRKLSGNSRAAIKQYEPAEVSKTIGRLLEMCQPGL